MSISVDIKKRFEGFSLETAFTAGDETLALLGASGCGKSVTLRCIAGIVRPDEGKIVVSGRTLFDSAAGIDLSPQKRRVGLMFQSYALFPNMTVRQNIMAGARRSGSGAAERAERLMESFSLSELAGRRPAQLSGGQQQRVALARMLVSDPELLMLDEPFSALDSHLRFRLEQELMDVIRGFSGSVLLVSHDRDEVFRISDRVAVMEDGRVTVCGEKKELFARPGTLQASILTGCKNNSPCRRLPDGRVLAEDWGVILTVPEGWDAPYVGIRMHDIVPGDGDNSVCCRVTRRVENPFSVTVMLTPQDGKGRTDFGMELGKDAPGALTAESFRVCLPPDRLLPLK